MLVAKKGSGEPVKRGDVLADFRGEEWTFLSATRATEDGRAGKVYVERDGSKRELYATVFDLRVDDVNE
jgi:5-hydroxyisourate hydrolase-like protein (transthyretin family)